MINIGINFSVASIMALFGLFFGAGIYDVSERNILSDRRLDLKYVRYNSRSEMFEQWLVPYGVAVINGAWSAAIYRGDKQLCSGGDNAPYSGRPVSYNASDWTGGDCPDTLFPTDIAVVNWEYKDGHGSLITISAKFKLGEYNGT